MDKVVELVGGGSVINGAYPVQFLNFQLSALHRKEVKCNSMDKNVDQGSVVECTAAHPRITKSTKKEENPCMFFSVSVLLLASVEKFGVSRMRDFFKRHLRYFDPLTVLKTFQIFERLCKVIPFLSVNLSILAYPGAAYPGYTD